MKDSMNEKIAVSVLFKDARGVSLYPYNWSQIQQHVKYIKYMNIAKRVAQVCGK